MFNKLPSEDELRAKAKEVGLADENGKYPPRSRGRLAAEIQRDKALAAEDAAEKAAEAADPLSGPTAAILARFDDELLAANILGDGRARILAAAATHLLETRDLRLAPQREETTP